MPTPLCKTVFLGHKKNRVPKKGDRVTAIGHEGVFAVYNVNHTLHSADLQQLGSDSRLAAIPWESISFLDGQDTSEAAARIVKEATKH
jgi:hypothetical protein